MWPVSNVRYSGFSQAAAAPALVPYAQAASKSAATRRIGSKLLTRCMIERPDTMGRFSNLDLAHDLARSGINDAQLAGPA